MANYSKSDIGLFPSNNIEKVNSRNTTEENISGMLRSITTKNHIIKGMDVTVSGSTLKLSDGSIYINGFVFTTTSSIELTIESTGTLYLYIYLTYDINNHIVGIDENDKLAGLTVSLESKQVSDNNDYILLGTVKNKAYTKSLDSYIAIDGGTW